MDRFVPIILVLVCLMASPIAALGQPTVTLSVGDALADEAGQDPASFTVTRTDDGDTAGQLLVWVTVGGTATIRRDYGFASIPVTPTTTDIRIAIPGGQLSTTVTLIPARDNLIEGTETFTVTLSDRRTAGNDYTIGTPDRAELAIADDVAEVSLTTNDDSADEQGQDPASFTVTRSENGDTAAELLVWLSAGGMATRDSDYTLANTNTGGTVDFRVVIPGDQLSATVTLTPIADQVLEGDETATFTLNPPATAGNDYTVGAPSNVVIVIQDLTETVLKDGFEP